MHLSTRMVAICLLSLWIVPNDLLAQLKNWSDPMTWPNGRVPALHETVVIPEGTQILLDISPPPLAGLTIAGSLIFKDQAIELSADWILVRGLLQIGTKEQPFIHKAIITLTGPEEDILGMGGRFLSTVQGGSLQLHGVAAQKLSWTQISGSVVAGATQLQVAETPTGWETGDEIAIAPSGYDPYEAERLTITQVEGNRIHFSPPLTFDHYGEIQTYAGKTIDQRAEVGLLSRNIIIQGAADSPELRFGGHTMMMEASGPIQVEGVTFRRMGQPGKEARYSFHWHLAGDRTGDYIHNCSIYDGLQRGIVVHGTDNVSVAHNVVYNVQNHAYIPAEDGNEINNLFLENLAILTRLPDEGYFAFPVEGNENKLSSQGEQRPSCFWLRNINNPLIGNHAAGAERGNGFFYDRFGRHRDFRHFDQYPDPIIFRDNVAHSCSVPGVNNNAGSNVAMYGKVGHGMGLFIDNFDNKGEVVYQFESFTAYKNDMSAIWCETEHTVLKDLILADNTSAFLTGDATIENALVVGRSNNTIGGRNRVLRHGHHRSGYYDIAQGGDKSPRLNGVTFVNMHEDTDNEAAAFIVSYKLNLEPNYTQNITLQNSRALWMETGGAPGRSPKGITLYDKDGTLSGTGQPTILIPENSPLRRDDCQFYPAWNACACPTDPFIDFLFPHRIKFHLEQEDGILNHSSGLNSKRTRVRAQEQYIYHYDDEETPLEEMSLGFSPFAASPRNYMYLYIPYPFPGIEIKKEDGTTSPRLATEAQVRSLDRTSYFFNPETGWLFLKSYAPDMGTNWYHVTPGSQEIEEVPGTISSEEIPLVNGLSVFPNPYQPSSRIEYQLTSINEISIELYDLLGRKLQPLFEGTQPAGQYTLPLTLDLSPGIYQIKITVGDDIYTLPLSKF